jgi:hypothetical protein
LAQRKINQMLESECTLEQLLEEDEYCLNQCKAANTRLTEFMSQRATLQKLVQFATQMPGSPDDHNVAHKYPFVAADILCSSKVIATALIEGGYQIEGYDNEQADEKRNDQDAEDSHAVQKMVRDSLNETNVSLFPHWQLVYPFSF